jgi:hypothetical protein
MPVDGFTERDPADRSALDSMLGKSSELVYRTELPGDRSSDAPIRSEHRKASGACGRCCQDTDSDLVGMRHPGTVRVRRHGHRRRPSISWIQFRRTSPE